MSKDGWKSNQTESNMIRAIDERRMFDKYRNVLKDLVDSDAKADQILKKTEPLAAVTLVTLLTSERPDVRRQAANDIMNRASGKAIERSMSLYGDIAKLSDQDLDLQIKRLTSQVSGTVVEVEAPKPLPRKRKPKIMPAAEKVIEDQRATLERLED